MIKKTNFFNGIVTHFFKKDYAIVTLLINNSRTHTAITLRGINCLLTAKLRS